MSLILHQGDQYVGSEKRWIREVSYWVVMPVVVVVGLAINSVAIHLLQKPRIRDLPAIASLRLLLGVDVAFLAFSVVTITTLDGYHLHSYYAALYFVHVCFIILNALQTFSHYIIAWISYNRFLALWCPQHFQKKQKSWVMKLRITLISLLCCGINIRRLLHVRVMCVTYGEVVVRFNHTEGCERGALLLQDNYKEGEEWLDFRLWLRIVLTLVVPGVLVLVFGVGIVVGLVRRRLKNTAATSNTRGQTYTAIYITVSLTVIFVITVTTNVVYCYVYNSNLENRIWSVNKEVFRVLLNLLLLAEHVTHIILALSQAFRDELSTLFRNAGNSLYTALARMKLPIWSSQGPRPVTHNMLAQSDDPTSITNTANLCVSHLAVSASDKQPDNCGSLVALHSEDSSEALRGEERANFSHVCDVCV